MLLSLSLHLPGVDLLCMKDYLLIYNNILLPLHPVSVIFRQPDVAFCHSIDHNSILANPSHSLVGPHLTDNHLPLTHGPVRPPQDACQWQPRHLLSPAGDNSWRFFTATHFSDSGYFFPTPKFLSFLHSSLSFGLWGLMKVASLIIKAFVGHCMAKGRRAESREAVYSGKEAHRFQCHLSGRRCQLLPLLVVCRPWVIGLTSLSLRLTFFNLGIHYLHPQIVLNEVLRRMTDIQKILNKCQQFLLHS